MKKKILIVEDNNDVNEMLCQFLQLDYQVVAAFSGTEGLLQFQSDTFDLVLLDRMLPGKTGEEVLKEIRKLSNIPVIMLTAVSEKSEITKLLLAGANDYITKPFDINELQARIVVQLRSSVVAKDIDQPTTITFKNLTLHPDSFQISCQGQRLLLKRKEFEILQLLIAHPKRVYTKEALYQEIWQEPYYGDENTINVHISNLRKKIKALDEEEAYIDTVWGIGIRLAEKGGL
ncbi:MULTISPECIES: response regulator transcription factor [unclassified Enterococcus]|uniref:response regulator transcription factor n=1 Tax=unclassified Enterococcus TaxID=2608891 RepID=UPI0024770418|nr:MULTISPECIES: response regulator transcription factor [unclassified Enterococcus]